MNLTLVKIGDIVLIDKRGRRFYAEVRSKDKELEIAPFDQARNPYFTASAREVVDLWKHYRPRSRSNKTKE